MASVTVPAVTGPYDQDVTVAIVPEDASGVAEPDSLSYSVDDPAFNFVPSADTLSCEVQSPRPPVEKTVNLTGTDPNGNAIVIPLNFKKIPGPVAQLIASAAFHPKPTP